MGGKGAQNRAGEKEELERDAEQGEGCSGEIEGSARAEVEQLAKQKRNRRIADEAVAERRGDVEAKRGQDTPRKCQTSATKFKAAPRKKAAKVRIKGIVCSGCLDTGRRSVEVVSLSCCP